MISFEAEFFPVHCFLLSSEANGFRFVFYYLFSPFLSSLIRNDLDGWNYGGGYKVFGNTWRIASCALQTRFMYNISFSFEWYHEKNTGMDGGLILFADFRYFRACAPNLYLINLINSFCNRTRLTLSISTELYVLVLIFK
jgi:hypothetical protein